MTPLDRIRFALRRSLVLIALCIAVCTIGIVLLEQRREAEYVATTRVLVQGASVAAVVAEGQITAQDPVTERANAVVIASSPTFQRRVAERLGVDPEAVDRDLSASADGDAQAVTLTATAAGEEAALQLANTAAAELPAYQQELFRDAVRESRRALEAAQRRDPEDEEISSALARLRVLDSIGPSATTLGTDEARSVEASVPRAIVQGIVVGLVIGLLLAGLREALDRRVRDPEELRRALDLPLAGWVPDEDGRLGPALASRLDDARAEAGGTAVAVVGAVDDPGRSAVTAALVRTLLARGDHVAVVDDGVNAVDEAAMLTPDRALADDEREPGAATSGRRRRRGGVEAALAPRLRVVPGAGSAGEPAAWSHERLEGLRAEHDWVVVESLPALTAGRGRRLSALADGVVLVVPVGGLTHEEMTRLRDEVARWPERPLALVLAR